MIFSRLNTFIENFSNTMSIINNIAAPIIIVIVENIIRITCIIKNNINGNTMKAPNCCASLVLETLDETKTILTAVNNPDAGVNNTMRSIKLISSKMLNGKTFTVR